MEQQSKGVVVQLVLPAFTTRAEIDTAVTAALKDIRQTLFEILKLQESGQETPAVIVRDFRIEGEAEHYA